MLIYKGKVSIAHRRDTFFVSVNPPIGKRYGVKGEKMDKESLEKIRNACIIAISKLEDVELKNRLEVELMELHLLDPRDYEDNRKVLQKEYERKHYR